MSCLNKDKKFYRVAEAPDAENDRCKMILASHEPVSPARAAKNKWPKSPPRAGRCRHFWKAIDNIQRTTQHRHAGYLTRYAN